MKDLSVSVQAVPPWHRMARGIAIFGVALLSACLLWSCDNSCQKGDPCDETCDRVGDCVITYTLNAKGEINKHTRKCALITKPDLSKCGECVDLKTNEEGKLVGKTCQVCNLCIDDFECLEDGDCNKAVPICERGTCVACKDDDDCTGDSNKGCFENKCVTCTKNSHCGGDTPVCLKNECVGCQENSDCKEPTRSRCNTKTNKCVACFEDNHCATPENPQCDNNECVPCRCASIDDKKPYCIKNKDLTVSCVGCQSDTDCANVDGTPVCDLTTGTCVAQCKQDNDCTGINQFCDNGTCVDCRSDSDCRDDQTPVCVKGKCGCSTDRDCPTSLPLCADNRCIECRRDRDCTVGFPICKSGVCNLLPCQTNSDCNRGNFNKCLRVGNGNFCVECLNNSQCTDQAKPTCDTGTWSCVK